jgi:hypothetical protein
MPNSIKYNTSTESLALRKGNFYVGTGDVGKGPTSTTGFYNGITPPRGGYTIYINKASGGPTIYVANSDSQLIGITNGIAGANYTTVNQCFNYFAGQSDKMVFNKDYEATITNGLVFNMDASILLSYPRNGTTWYDISTSANSGTLVNGPSYDSIGVMSFDGSDDSIYCTNFGISQTFTVSSWVRCTNVAGENNIVSKNGPYFMRISNSKVRFNLLTDTGGWLFQNGTTTLLNNKWYNLVMTYDGSSFKGYINSNLEFSTSKTGSIVHNSNFYIGYTPEPGENGGFNGNIMSVMVHNRSLSSTEILQNYYAGNTTTSGMVLFLDGNNIISYPKTGTVWTDMSPSNYSVTNCNFQTGRNNRLSLYSDGNNADIETSSILNNDYHTIEMVLMFKNTGDYPNGWTGGWEQFFGYFSGGSDRSPGVWRYPSERRIHWRYDPGNSGVDFGKNLAGDQFDLNTYYHVLVTKNGGVAEAWVNGTFVNSNSVSFPKTSGNAVLRFFDYYSSGLMEIQVCKIYNRVLTNQEIYTNYNSLASRL